MAVPPRDLVTSQRVGLYQVEANGTLDGARETFGLPDEERRYGNACALAWEEVGVQITFTNNSGRSPCDSGDFCEAHMWQGDWTTSRGLQVGESVRRLWRLYPQARVAPEAGEIQRYVLERGPTACGRSAKAGLAADTSGGKIMSFKVSFLAGH